jgi:type 1 glutamine amidotransferase
MRKHLGRITLGAMLLLLSGLLATADAQEKIKVLLIDGQNNHNWQATTPFMKKVLEESGRFTVDVATTPPRPKQGEEDKYKEAMAKFRPNFKLYDVVLSNYNGLSWPAETQKALEEYLSSGKGLVIVHAANNSFETWPEYNQMIGMGWRNSNKFGERLVTDDTGKPVRVEKGQGPAAGHGPPHPFQVVIRNAEHPVTRDMPREWMHAQDELYHGMRGPVQNMTILATAFSDKSKKGTGDHEPMMWTVSFGKGRVFHTPMGHDLNGMRCIGFITTLRRGTEWAATGNVTIAVPKDFPTAKEVKQMAAH